MTIEPADTRPTLVMDIQETSMIVNSTINEMRELRKLAASAHTVLKPPVKQSSDGAGVLSSAVGTGERNAAEMVEPSLRDMVGYLRDSACDTRTLSETTRMNVDSLVVAVLRRLGSIQDDVLQTIDHTNTAHKQLSLVNNISSVSKDIPVETSGNSCPYASLAYGVLYLEELIAHLKSENADLTTRMDGIFGMSLAGEPAKGTSDE